MYGKTRGGESTGGRINVSDSVIPEFEIFVVCVVSKFEL